MSNEKFTDGRGYPFKFPAEAGKRYFQSIGKQKRAMIRKRDHTLLQGAAPFFLGMSPPVLCVFSEMPKAADEILFT